MMSFDLVLMWEMCRHEYIKFVSVLI